MGAILRRCAWLLPAMLAAAYLVYVPDAQFVLDHWWMFQAFARAPDRWEMAAALVQNRIWGAFRINGLGYGLWGLAGWNPAVYFLSGLALQALLGYLLYLTGRRLGLAEGTALAAGAVFVVLPTVHNVVFWFPNWGQYQFSVACLLLYLYGAAGPWSWRAGAGQAAAVALGFLSGDQVFALLAGSALWMAVVTRSRAWLRPAAVAWATMAVVGALYVGWVNRAPVGGTMAAKFDFGPGRALKNVQAALLDYAKLAGLGGYYRMTPEAAATGVLAGALAWWWLRGRETRPSLRWMMAGAGFWALGYAPVLFLRWRELRYDHLPSLGLAIVLAAACRSPAAAAAVTGWSAGTVAAEARQCWQPMSRNTQAVIRELRRLENLRDHEIVAVAGTPSWIGTAPHFGMFNSYSATPFVETVTGVFGLYVGRAILYDTGRLGLEHIDFFRELKEEDLQRTHVVACEGLEDCSVRTLMAREVGPGRFAARPLKNYRGPPIDLGRTYTRAELPPGGVYFTK
jgi:hypothetical protein